MLDLKIITKPSECFWNAFDKLSFETFAHNVQFRSEWLKPYIKFQLKGEVYIIAVYNKDMLVGCLPLEITKQKATRFWSFRVLQILGTGPTDFFDILARDDNRLNIQKRILEFLRKKNNWDYINLGLLPLSFKNLSLINEVFFSKQFKINENETYGFLYEKTINSWNTYLDNVFNKKNKDLNKGERRLKKDSIDYSFKTYNKNVFERFIASIDLYAQRRETLGQYNYYKDYNYRMFLKSVCNNYEQFGGVEFTVMKDSRKNVAMAIQLDFINKGIRYHWNHAFNEDYKRYSPGKLLLKEILKNSFADSNILACNHMRGLSNYKKSFTTYEEKMLSYRIERVNSIRVRLTNTASRVLKLLR